MQKTWYNLKVVDMLAYKPKFWDSPYLVRKGDIDTWYLKEGAPKELVEELEEVKKLLKPSKDGNPNIA